MSTVSRLESLRKRHQEVDGFLSFEQTRPQPDELRLGLLKKKKLHLKDEILRLQQQRGQ